MITHNQALLAILGAGGIGKTSIALHINNAKEVRAKYSDASYFLPCELLPDAKSLLQGIIQRLDIQIKGGESQHKELEQYFTIHSQPTLLIFDNFETLWNNDQVDTESLIAKLIGFKSVSIIVTMRGMHGPGEVDWKILGSDSIPPLALDSARKAFISNAQREEMKQKYVIIDSLLKELDCVPLAITLLGRRAKTVPLDSLMRMWQNGKTSVLNQGGAPGRLTSVDHSIRLSTKLLSSQELKLLAIICFLPDGVPGWVSNLPQMLPDFPELDHSISRLLEYSLVYSQHQNIRVLAPIREYVSKANTQIGLNIGSVESFYFSWLKTLSGDLQQKQDQIQFHILNLTKIMSEKLRSSPDVLLIEAVNILYEFTKFYPIILDIVAGILDQYPDLEQEVELELKFQTLCMLR
jgi:hypothetical protein